VVDRLRQEEGSYRIIIKGIVQGVGFRPFIYRVATSYELRGNVCNSSNGVIINVQGERKALEKFLEVIRERHPRLASITSLEIEEVPLSDYRTFEIIRSQEKSEREALIPADISICPECSREVLDKKNRRYMHPFTNCTACGPRFTIIRNLPYDRNKTSMAKFAMCDKCSSEYHDPSDRRFHAQPIACPDCGPSCEFVKGTERSAPWLESAWEAISKGEIVAVKGLGGFHLACDARNASAVERLRALKGRGDKPLAVMCANVEVVRAHCELSEHEEKVLTSPQAPIVILKKRADFSLPEALAPGLSTLGVMIPYTPLHLLLLNGPFDVLVMTSGNYSGLPLVKSNEKALRELGRIADSFVFHDREIVNRCDDSVVFCWNGQVSFIRRSRGYVPNPIEVCVRRDAPPVLGIGGDMKNTFCLIWKGQAFMTQHIGETDTIEGEENLIESISNFERLLGTKHAIVGYDLHPEYRSSQIARTLEACMHVPCQHHHAHMVSCMAENKVEDPTIGVILDGTGYGHDGTIWGFEILEGDAVGFQRLYHLNYVPLPGGERSVRFPWRMAVVYLLQALGEEGRRIAERKYGEREDELNIVVAQMQSGFNSPLTSSCGRLFDAVSSLLNICHENTYEGQAAIEMSELLIRVPPVTQLDPYPYKIKDRSINLEDTIKSIIADAENGVPKEVVTKRFHDTIVKLIVDAVNKARAKTGITTVVLSGGTWQNRYLLSTTSEILKKEGYKVLYHSKVPSNDGGIALGQAIIAYQRWKKHVSRHTVPRS